MSYCPTCGYYTGLHTCPNALRSVTHAIQPPVIQFSPAAEIRITELEAEVAALKAVLLDVHKASKMNMSTWGLWIREKIDAAIASQDVKP